MPFVVAGGHRLEYEWLGPPPAAAPTIVMLHEGLGSVAMWRDFPARVQETTGLGVLVYSRWGYGKSEPVADWPHPPDYMTREAEGGLHGILRALGVARPILFGHSDGASIALIYAGLGLAPAPLGVVSMAAHLFVEKISSISIAKARVAYEEGELRDRLAKYHADVDSAFYSWNCSWMLPKFIREWNIEALVERIRCPILAIQGVEDEYGTPAQLEAIRRRAGGRAEIVLIPDCRHSPHRDKPDIVLEAVRRHCALALGRAAA